MQAIDSHHHIWDPSVGDFSWMTEAHNPIKRKFTTEDLEPLLHEAGISHTLVVQTWSSIEETEAFLSFAGKTSFIAGVVGWIDFTKDVAPQIERLMDHPHACYLKSLRHQVHDEPNADWLTDRRVQAGFAALKRFGLSYDLLIRTREIPAAISCAKKFPEQKFIVNHIAKPRIASGWDDDWDNKISRLANYRKNVWIKLSGLVTEADWKTWKETDIAPYIDRVIELFGSERVMLGSDWPVCTLAANYCKTIDLIRHCISKYQKSDQISILRNSAVAAYSLEL